MKLIKYLTRYEALQLIKDASGILLKGILYLSTMEDNYSNSKIISPSNNKNIGLFTYYHEVEYLSEFLQKNNFNIL